MGCGALGGGRRCLGMVSPVLLQKNLAVCGSFCSCRVGCDEPGLMLSCYGVGRILG